MQDIWRIRTNLLQKIQKIKTYIQKPFTQPTFPKSMPNMNNILITHMLRLILPFKIPLILAEMLLN